jgi:hypothetical protein
MESISNLSSVRGTANRTNETPSLKTVYNSANHFSISNFLLSKKPIVSMSSTSYSLHLTVQGVTLAVSDLSPLVGLNGLPSPARC